MAKMPRRFDFGVIIIAGQRQRQNIANQLRWHPAHRRQNSTMLADELRHLVAFPD
jgi:hypothetical protein